EVAGATVKIGSATVTTDAHGWYEAVVNSGTYTLTAAAEGYKAYSRALKVESDDITCNINLIAADENVETTTLAACVRNEFDGGVFRFENLIVTAVFDECIYATDGVRGVKVVGAGITGGKFDLVGAIRTGADGERYIDADSVIVTDPSAKVRPVFVNWNAVGGNNFGRQKGAKDTRGVNNIGMFVKSMGVVGKEIIVGSGSSYRNGDCLVVTGIVTLDDNGNSAIRMTGVEKVN
ncbi:MAG: hypothetical protein J6X53_05770, partial [Abditibacteriota bacterium]|nr:hypothetical protein [Abditibacteriota bacterium]